MSRSIRPIDRHTAILFVRRPQFAPGVLPVARTALQAASRASSIRALIPQNTKAKMSYIRSLLADCHTTLRVPSANGAKGGFHVVQPQRVMARASAWALRALRLNLMAATGRPSKSAVAARCDQVAASDERRSAFYDHSSAMLRKITRPVPQLK